MLVVKKFSGDWCQPCRMLKPVMNEIKMAYPSVMFEDIDVDMNENEASKYGVRSVPTVVIVKDGREVNRLTGLQSKMMYQNVINESLR